MTSSFIGKVLDNYRILENLGVGGMGVVFKAMHIKLDKLVALKMIAPGMAMNERFIKRFQTEARALAKLEDPNIVAIYDLRSDNDQWFIVMEYVDGSNLFDKIRKEGAFPWQQAVPVLKQILTAIGHAHRAGIIHRDLKPNNIMLTKNGTVKITDFGLAKDQNIMANSMTVASGGTLYYMSPEHVKGFSFTDKRSDLYSIGMTFYEMITGKVPFENIDSDFDIRERIIRKDFVKPSTYKEDIPEELDAIIMKSIAKDPEKRYQSAEEMLEAILAFEEKQGLTGTQRPETPQKPVAPARTTFPLVKVVIPIVILLAVLYLLIFKYPNFLHPELSRTNPSSFSSLHIKSRPQQAQIFLNDSLWGVTPFTRDSMPNGRYALRIGKESFKPIDTTLTLPTGAALDLSFKLSPLPEMSKSSTPSIHSRQPLRGPATATTQLIIRSRPSGAGLWLNNQYQGKTPFRSTNAKPGNYRIRITKQGFEDYTRQLNVPKGRKQSVEARLIPFYGTLDVRTRPKKARLWIDGKLIAGKSTPCILDKVPIGQHQLKIAKNGFAEYVQEIEIDHSQTRTLNITLKPLMGKLSILVIPWGSIYINNQLQEASSDVKNQIEVPVGQYQIKIVHPTLGFWQKTIRVDSNQPKTVRVNFNQKIAVQISAVDKAGQSISGHILIDGKDTGQMTPREMRIRTGVHRFLIKKENYIAVNGEEEFLIDTESNPSLKFVLEKME